MTQHATALCVFYNYERKNIEQRSALIVILSKAVYKFVVVW